MKKTFQPFYDRPDINEYKTSHIGNDYGPEYEIKKSTFSSVSDHTGQLIYNVEEDLRKSRKNMEFLKQSIINVDETTKEGLSGVTKELGNKIILFYDNLTELINKQRCNNLQLQLEINHLNKEKNTMRNDLNNLVTSVKKMETVLGVDKDPKFEGMVTHTIYN